MEIWGSEVDPDAINDNIECVNYFPILMREF